LSDSTKWIVSRPDARLVVAVLPTEWKGVLSLGALVAAEPVGEHAKGHIEHTARGRRVEDA